jgi:hypothetical protein
VILSFPFIQKHKPKALTDNLLAFYKLSNTSDSSGNNRSLTNNGGVTFAPGKIGNAAVLGADQTLSASFEIPEGQKSLSLWFLRSSSINGGGFANYTYIVLGFNLGDPSGIGLTITDTGVLLEVANEVEYNDDIWHHICATYDGALLKTFIDGAQVTNAEPPYNVLAQGGCDSFVIKEEFGFARGAIKVDATGIWNRALSDAEVASLYNSGTGIEIG